ncbi:hypothetical protein TorRG33x02_016230 [Trema orientale]|uniref:Uncharacterized protein n=1 Tax=Trema orientale TaxID=63057 RepID=A0A2P5FY06_TREOI|nr:hypothetical protein TorRG33x02_016230 [Trema orientale]
MSLYSSPTEPKKTLTLKQPLKASIKAANGATPPLYLSLVLGDQLKSQNEREREGVAMMIKQIERYTLRSIDDFVSSTFELLLL